MDKKIQVIAIVFIPEKRAAELPPSICDVLSDVLNNPEMMDTDDVHCSDVQWERVKEVVKWEKDTLQYEVRLH